MTWNVENLYPVGSKYGPKTQEIYDVKLDGLAAVINQQAPDALAVQEVGDPACLDDLIGRLAGGAAAWRKEVSQHPDARGIRVAWLSPHVLSDAADVVDFPNGQPAVQVEDDGSTINVMGRGALAVTV